MNKLYNGDVLKMVALVDTVARDVVAFEASIGIAQTSGLAGELISVDTTGVYEFPAKSADVIKVGDVVKYNATTGNIEKGTGGMVGVAWSAKVAGETTVEVKIG